MNISSSLTAGGPRAGSLTFRDILIISPSLADYISNVPMRTVFPLTSLLLFESPWHLEYAARQNPGFEFLAVG